MKRITFIFLTLLLLFTSITSFAKSTDLTSAEIYSEGYFATVGGAYNLENIRKIEMYFDTDVSTYSAIDNIFAACDKDGNGERIKLIIRTEGKKITVAPSDKWPEGDMYIFIKGSLCDSHGNLLGRNLKYKLNIRGNINDK